MRCTEMKGNTRQVLLNQYKNFDDRTLYFPLKVTLLQQYNLCFGCQIQTQPVISGQEVL